MARLDIRKFLKKDSTPQDEGVYRQKLTAEYVRDKCPEGFDAIMDMFETEIRHLFKAFLWAESDDEALQARYKAQAIESMVALIDNQIGFYDRQEFLDRQMKERAADKTKVRFAAQKLEEDSYARSHI